MKRLILASESPRRKELLSKLGLPFEVMHSDYEEDMNALPDPRQLAKFLSLNKAKSVAQKVKGDAIIIAADTFVVHNNTFLGKPHTPENAKVMLQSLQGQTHSVITGLAIIDTATNKIVNEISETKVTMRAISDDEIDWYVTTGEPLDKAGAYAIQGGAAIFVEKIDGDYFTVMGLPLCLLSKKLKEFN
jgi:septum formation protein